MITSLVIAGMHTTIRNWLTPYRLLSNSFIYDPGNMGFGTRFLKWYAEHSDTEKRTIDTEGKNWVGVVWERSPLGESSLLSRRHLPFVPNEDGTADSLESRLVKMTVSYGFICPDPTVLETFEEFLVVTKKLQAFNVVYNPVTGEEEDGIEVSVTPMGYRVAQLNKLADEKYGSAHILKVDVDLEFMVIVNTASEEFLVKKIYLTVRPEGEIYLIE